MVAKSIYIDKVLEVREQAFPLSRKYYCNLICTGPTGSTLSLRLAHEEAEKLYRFLGEELGRVRR